MADVENNSPAKAAAGIQLETTGIVQLAISPDGLWMAALGYESSAPSKLQVDIYRTRDWTRIKTLPFPDAAATGFGLTFSPNGKYLAAGSNQVAIWKAADWSTLDEQWRDWNNHAERSRVVESLVFSSDGRTLTALYSAVIQVADLPPGIRPRRRFSIVKSVAIEPGGTDFEFTPLHDPAKPALFSKQMAIGRDHEVLLSWREPSSTGCCGSANLAAFDIRTGKLTRRVEGVQGGTLAVIAVSADRTQVATGITNGGMTSALQPDGKWLGHTDNDPIRVWDMAAFDKKREYAPMFGRLVGLFFNTAKDELVSCRSGVGRATLSIQFPASASGRFGTRDIGGLSPSGLSACAVTADGANALVIVPGARRSLPLQGDLLYLFPL